MKLAGLSCIFNQWPQSKHLKCELEKPVCLYLFNSNSFRSCSSHKEQREQNPHFYWISISFCFEPHQSGLLKLCCVHVFAQVSVVLTVGKLSGSLHHRRRVQLLISDLHTHRLIKQNHNHVHHCGLMQQKHEHTNEESKPAAPELH